jgi:hypothetical protein
MKAYKLFRKRKNGTYGPLFINKRQKLLSQQVYEAEDHPTKGYAHRPGWHCCAQPVAPHLSKKDRVWCVVYISDYETVRRPDSQGGLWYLAKRMWIESEM